MLSKIHTLLYSDLLFGLKQRKSDVGSVFLRHLERVSRLYCDYCVNLPVAMDTLERLLASNAALRKQVFECQSRATPSTFPLSSHLVIPFQVDFLQSLLYNMYNS